jgi:hypothetical protein
MNDAPLPVSLIAHLPDARLVQLSDDLGRGPACASIQQRGEWTGVSALMTRGTIKAKTDRLKAYLPREPVLGLGRADGRQVVVTALRVDTPATHPAAKAAICRSA